VFTIVVDTREQTPFDFGPDVPIVAKGLDTGDYSILGLEDLVCLERKSLDDFLGCVGRHRERFERELHRMRSFRCKAVIIETTRARLTAGNWRGKITPGQALGSIAGWRVRHGIEFIYAGTAAHGADEALRLLTKYHEFCVDFVKKIEKAVKVTK